MNVTITKQISGSKLQFFLGAALLLFLFRLFFGGVDLMLFHVLNDLLVLITFILLLLNLVEIVKSRRESPLSLIVNVGVISALIFFLTTFSGSIVTILFGKPEAFLNEQGLIFKTSVFVYCLIFMGFLGYIFLVFKELYFYKQNKNVTTYFKTMLIFFILASFSSLIPDEMNLSFVSNSFIIISILLIIFNSIKISWIAFIVKKEKISLLIMSIIISVLFIINLANSSEGNLNSKLLADFSPSLQEFYFLLMIYGTVYFTILFFTTLFHIPTAEAYDKKAKEVSSLQYFSKLITQVFDFNDLAETVTEITVNVSNADAAFISWLEAEESENIALKNIGFLEAKAIAAYVHSTRERSSKRDTEIINLNRSNKNFPGVEKFSSLVISPLSTHNQFRGYLIAIKKGNMIFNDEDRNAIDTLSDYASVAFENSRLLKESIEKERLEKELDVAREIQKKILPEKNPEHKNLEISSVFIPAFEVGGDYYDFFEIDENKLGFVIADVSGKGISAAFIMAEVKGIFGSLSDTVKNPREILIRANRILKGTLDKKTFVSAAFGLIDFENRKLVISRAGHCPVMLLRNNAVEHIRPSGLGLGLSYAERFAESLEEVEISLKNEDIIVLYTDGITEAKNKKLEDFGETNFEKILVENSNLNPDEISSKVIKAVTLFSKEHSQYDDITLVIFKWKHKTNHHGEKEWKNSTPHLNSKVM